MQSLSSQGMTRYAPKEQKKTERKGECYRFMADGVRIAMISSQSRIGTTTMALGFTQCHLDKDCFIVRNSYTADKHFVYLLYFYLITLLT